MLVVDKQKLLEEGAFLFSQGHLEKVSQRKLYSALGLEIKKAFLCMGEGRRL